MTIVGLIVLLVFLGLIFFLVEKIPMADPFPVIIRVLAVVIAILIVLQFFGVVTGLPLLHT
jgi:hypothetical protein